MRTFRDVNGGEWELDLTIGAAEPLEDFLREHYEVDIFNSTQTYAHLSRPTFALNCLSLLCREQREKKQITPEEFGRLFKGESAYNAQRVLLLEYVDFFPDPTVQRELKSALTRSLGLSEREQQLIRRSLTLALNKYEEIVDGLARVLTEADLGNTPESPESEPTTSG